MPALHQLTAGYAEADAISNEARLIRRLLRERGWASEIYTDPRHCNPRLRGDAQPLDALRPAADDLLLLHLSIGSPVNERFAGLPGRRILLYHNITPPAYLRFLDAAFADRLQEGLDQARRLAGSVQLALADSAFNARELEALGHRDVRVLPYLVDGLLNEVPPDPDQLARLRDGRLNVLFVGRGAPNKKIEDLLFAFHYLQRYVEPHARLIHVGSYAGLEAYHGFLHMKAAELGLEEVHFLGSIPQARLNACYAAADVFLCLSEHEGFCVPLLEAMARQVPVLAYAAGAVPETMGGAGVLLRDKQFDAIAEMIRRLARDPALRAAVLAGQAERLQRYRALDPAVQLQQALGLPAFRAVLAAPPPAGPKQFYRPKEHADRITRSGG